MNHELIRLFLPVGAGVLLGLFAAFRGFLRAWREVPDSPGFVRLLASLAAASPVTKLFYAAILAFVAAAPVPDAGEPVFQRAGVLFLVAGNVMGLMAFAQGFVAAARMPKMLVASPKEGKQDFANGFLGSSGKPGAIPVTLMIQGFFETPALFAMIGGMIALQTTN